MGEGRGREWNKVSCKDEWTRPQLSTFFVHPKTSGAGAGVAFAEGWLAMVPLSSCRGSGVGAPGRVWPPCTPLRSGQEAGLGPGSRVKAVVASTNPAGDRGPWVLGAVRVQRGRPDMAVA